MISTLSERLKIAMKGPPKVKGKELAAACDVSAASVSDWITGKTKTMEGPNLTRAADYLKVRAKWLAEGVGPMCKADDSDVIVNSGIGPGVNRLEPPDASYVITPKADPRVGELLALFARLDSRGKVECLRLVEGFVAGRSPHAHGQASAMAG